MGHVLEQLPQVGQVVRVEEAGRAQHLLEIELAVPRLHCTLLLVVAAEGSELPFELPPCVVDNGFAASPPLQWLLRRWMGGRLPSDMIWRRPGKGGKAVARARCFARDVGLRGKCVCVTTAPVH